VPVAAITIEFALPAHFLDGGGQRAGFVLLAAFLLSFLFIRTSARLIRSPRVTWWPGSVTTDSGLHLHHLVWGIVTMISTGFLSFAINPDSPWNEILAGLFGVGAGLTLDEFALWVYLRDVYWSEEGRVSLEAVVVAAALGGLIVCGVAPFDLPHDTASVTTLAATVLIVLALTAVAIVKGRPFVGLIGIFIPLASIAAICRLAAPTSLWARRFYKTDTAKLTRSRARFEHAARRRRRLADAIGGSPSVPAESLRGGQAAEE
jgi:hypothetical protein